MSWSWPPRHLSFARGKASPDRLQASGTDHNELQAGGGYPWPGSSSDEARRVLPPSPSAIHAAGQGYRADPKS